MFGLSFTEIVILLLVGIVVVGPRKLPALMGSAGRWIRKIRQLSTDLRSQSGLDDLIRQEGLEKELRELRSLSRSNMLTNLVESASRPAPARLPPKTTPAPAPGAAAASAAANGSSAPHSGIPGTVASGPRPVVSRHPNDPVREREYPVIGCDSYGALPDDLDDPALYEGEISSPPPPEPGAGDGEPKTESLSGGAT